MKNKTVSVRQLAVSAVLSNLFIAAADFERAVYDYERILIAADSKYGRLFPAIRAGDQRPAAQNPTTIPDVFPSSEACRA